MDVILQPWPEQSAAGRATNAHSTDLLYLQCSTQTRSAIGLARFVCHTEQLLVRMHTASGKCNWLEGQCGLRSCCRAQVPAAEVQRYRQGLADAERTACLVGTLLIVCAALRKLLR